MAESQNSNTTLEGLRASRRWLHAALTLAAGAGLLILAGWTGEITSWLHGGTIGLGIIYAVDRGSGLMKLGIQRSDRRRRILQGTLAAIVLCVALSIPFHLLPTTGRLFFAAHVFILLAVLVSGLASMTSHQTRFTARAFSPGWVLILSFFAIILIGTLLLKMPRCTVPGQTCSWLDALFTSTSAVCVTGLTVQNTATFFSHSGQLVILMLIQIGGLGIMTLTFFAAVLLFEGLTLHDRLLLGRMIQENRLARVGKTLSFIVAMTFICEGIGAAILFASMGHIHDIPTRLFHSVFHAVSAFCNAGFSTFPDNLADSVVRGNQIWQLVLMSLIVLGGLGALVNEDITLWTVAKFKRRFNHQGPHPRLRVHTRLVLVVNAILITGGAALIYLTEFQLWNGSENGGTAITSFFHAVTARTAGFNTVSMSNIGPLTVQMLMILMIIGGSPGGTAGGMRTTVVAVGLGHLWNQLRAGRRGMIIFNRKIPTEIGAQALGVIFLTLIWLMLNFIILQALESGTGLKETKLLFELISAFATVGLSLDVTPTLTAGAKTLLIVNMFVGRIGLLTVMATLIKADPRPASGKPEEDILLT